MPVSVKARCFNGKAYDLTLDSAAPTVSDLQSSISAASGITPDRQTILYKGQVLDASSTLSAYSLTDGASISVVRRIGKSPAPAPASTPTPAPAPAAAPAASPTAAAPDAPQPPSLDEMMRSLNMGGGAGGAGNNPMPNLASLLGGMNPAAAGGAGAAAAGAGAGAGGAAPPANMEQLFSQLPSMMNGLLNTPLFKEYLNNTEKQEQSREAILNNPFMKSLLETDPEFADVINDPEKWRASMEAAKSLLPDGTDPSAIGDGVPTAEDVAKMAAAAAADSTATATAAPRGVAEAKSKVVAAAAARQSAAQLAPPGIDINKLSESYGHALGQSLINSGLGLDPDLVVKGLKTAVDGKPFPMSLPEYEREMATLQNIASDYLKKVNLEDANQFFDELRGEGAATMLEEGKIAYETSEVEAEPNAPVAKEGATVLVIVSARLLDGRHFFTCPAADGKGDSVHPLTLPLETAPKALTKGIVGMKENESRLLYVHPTACDGMTEMFGDLLPPNALLIFDLQLVSADAPEEEAVGESYFNNS